jgi:general secretion pathway protein D
MSFNRTFALFLLGIASTYGQQPAEDQPVPQAPPGVAIPGAAEVPAAGVPDVKPSAAAVDAAAAAKQPGVPLEQTKIVNDINEPKLSGNQLAGLYRTYTGHRVIVSAAAATAEFSFVQEASEKDSLTFAEAAELLRKAAIIENFVFVPDGLNPNLEFLTFATGGIRPTQIGVKVYNENVELPDSDAVISYVMSLNHIKPAEAVNIFTQIVGAPSTYGSIAAVPNAAAVVITENTSLIRKLIDLKKEIDKPSSQVCTRFITVKYADVTEIASTLTELLTAQQSTQTTAGIQRAGSPQPIAITPSGAPQVQVGGQAAGGEGGSSEATPVQIIPDPRTNRIFAMGRPIDLEFVAGLVREFDVETSQKNFLRRKLKFLKVSEFLPIATDALTRAFSGTGTGGGSSAPGGAAAGAQAGGGNRSQARSNRQASSNGGRNGGRNGGGNNSGSSGANFGGGSSGAGGAGGGAGGSFGGGASLSSGDVSSAPESALVGRTLLVADNITNSVVVQGPPSDLEIIVKLLDQIDVKPDQVMISTVIGQLTLNDNFKVGLDYLNLGTSIVGRGGNGSGPTLPILNQLVAAIPGIPAVGTVGQPGYTAATPGTSAQSKFNPGTLPSVGGLQIYGKIGNNLNVYLQALQAKTDFTVLSRPSIFTANNVEGTISSGERIAIPTGSNSYGGNNNSSTQIEYQNVVLELAVRPLVNSQDEITLEISLGNDELNGTQEIAGGGGNGTNLTVPRISTRKLQTTVTVPNNQTVVLGGLISAKDSKSKSGIPILSSIPYIGGLFGSDQKNKDRSELMVFIQPSIVSNDRSLDAVQADMDSRYKVSDRAHAFADGPGVLPPIDAITPVEDKGGTRHPSNSTRFTPAIDPSAPVITKKKQAIGPAHRR